MSAATPSQAAITRAIAACQKAGMAVRQVTIRDGAIIITDVVDTGPESAQPASVYDGWKAKRAG